MKAKNTIKQVARKWRSALADLVFPRTCFFCKSPKTLLCPDCESLCEVAPAHSRHSGKYIADCYAAASYDNRFIERLIASFKYEPFSKELAKPLARLIGQHFELLDSAPDFKEFIIAAVPLSKKRLRWRGYNQAQELAKILAEILDIPLDPSCLARLKETACQVGLGAKNRQANVAGAFGCPIPSQVLGKKILLVDDVITTGATVEECAKTLIKNGAKEVIALAIARQHQ